MIDSAATAALQAQQFSPMDAANPTGSVLVIGLGEVGRPLLEIIGERYPAVGVDIDPVELDRPCEIMHICFPFEVDDFVGETARYIEAFHPRLTIINSTVALGATRAIHAVAHAPVVHSPVRGKHLRMRQELHTYTKFIGGIKELWSEQAAAHFQSLGMKTRVLASPEATELAKLTETTYFALLIAWAQELERYCDDLSLDYGEVVSFYQEVGYFPPVQYFPGVIGGHCLMPNLAILKRSFQSEILDFIEESDRLKRTRELSQKQSLLGEALRSNPNV